MFIQYVNKRYKASLQKTWIQLIYMDLLCLYEPFKAWKFWWNGLSMEGWESL